MKDTIADNPLLQQEIQFEHDVVLTRQRTRQLAALLGFDRQDQTRVATAVSEIARNAFQYAGGGRVTFTLQRTAEKRTLFTIQVRDEGAGIPHLAQILGRQYTSRTGMGMGILGAQRLMDDFRIEPAEPRGMLVTLSKLTPRPIASGEIRRVVDALARQTPLTALEELQQQNSELLRTLQELRAREAELTQLNRELEDTNRGVVALYAELDEKAFSLSRANDVKTRFLSNMTHEFRTPLNSILSLTRLLLDRVDGPLLPEQEKQLGYIRRSAETLSELVNDLLDLAKVEAGKVLVRPTEFRVADLFGALRGMLKPLLAANNAVTLVFEPAEHVPPLQTDEGKVAQILRNFISNALKYTEAGEVRVSARLSADESVVFTVADTGIGIAPEDQEHIFEEYSQIDSPLQRRARGTGLGLPLSRKLAVLLGGNIFVESEVGKGSIFHAVIAREYRGPAEVAYVPDLTTKLDPARLPVLVVEDNREALFVYEKYVKGSGFQVIPASTIDEASRLVREVGPIAVILDILLHEESTWGLLVDLKRNPATRDMPVFVVTVIENEAKALALGADAFHQKPLDRAWLLGRLKQVAGTRREPGVLVVDDDEIARYLLKNALASTRLPISEAPNGAEGLRRAHEEKPGAIILDLGMPDLDGFVVLEKLKADPATREIPVIIHTARPLTQAERSRLAAATAIIPKENPSPEAMRSTLLAALSEAGLFPVN
ncbi:MAG: ATP-binding protein [Sulfurifustaceae bacterium]